ncbi:MAG: hypothetical protein ACI9CP_001795 [Cryomorphaceae bacterium]|jgi:hypothetical protein
MINRSLFYTLFLLLILASCNNDDDDNDDFPSSVGIKGKVLTQNEFQQPLYDERDGVEFHLEVGFREFFLDADNVGQWQLGGAPVGTYAFILQKEGYGTIEQRGVRISTVNPEYPVFNSFQTIPTFVMTKLPITQFEDVELDLTFTTEMIDMEEDTIWNLDMSAEMSPAPPPTGQAKGYRVFWGTDEFLSTENYLFQAHYTATSPEIALNYNDQIFDLLGVQSGDVIYAQFYGDANFNLEFTNQDGTLTFPNLSEVPSPTVSVALP